MKTKEEAKRLKMNKRTGSGKELARALRGLAETRKRGFYDKFRALKRRNELLIRIEAARKAAVKSHFSKLRLISLEQAKQEMEEVFTITFCGARTYSLLLKKWQKTKVAALMKLKQNNQSRSKNYKALASALRTCGQQGKKISFSKLRSSMIQSISREKSLLKCLRACERYGAALKFMRFNTWLSKNYKKRARAVYDSLRTLKKVYLRNALHSIQTHSAIQSHLKLAEIMNVFQPYWRKVDLRRIGSSLKKWRVRVAEMDMDEEKNWKNKSIKILTLRSRICLQNSFWRLMGNEWTDEDEFLTSRRVREIENMVKVGFKVLEIHQKAIAKKAVDCIRLTALKRKLTLEEGLEDSDHQTQDMEPLGLKPRSPAVAFPIKKDESRAKSIYYTIQNLRGSRMKEALSRLAVWSLRRSIEESIQEKTELAKENVKMAADIRKIYEENKKNLGDKKKLQKDFNQMKRYIGERAIARMVGIFGLQKNNNMRSAFSKAKTESLIQMLTK